MITCNLNVLLAERNMKISELAKMTGISRTTVTALAYNKSKGIQFDTFDSICSALHVQPNDLFKQEIFDYEFSVKEFSDESPFGQSGTTFVTEFNVTYRNKKIKELIPLVIELPFTIKMKEDDIKRVLKVYAPADYQTYESYKILDEIPITFKTAFYDELKESLRSYLLIMDISDTKMDEEEIENCIIDINY